MTLRAFIPLAVFSLLFAGPADRPSAVDRVSNADMIAALTQTMRSEGKGVSFRLASDGNAQYIMNRRTAPSAIELHCVWDDLLIIRSGVGVLAHSAKLKGLQRYLHWEWRAQSMVEPVEVSLAAGDVVRVPAGRAHAIRSLGDAPLIYLVVKLRSAEATPCGSLPQHGL